MFCQQQQDDNQINNSSYVGGTNIQNNPQLEQYLYCCEILKQIHQNINSVGGNTKRVDSEFQKNLHILAQKIDENRKQEKEKQKKENLKYKNYLVHTNKINQKQVVLRNYSFLFVKYILYYLEIEEIVSFSAVNKSANEIYKMHIQFRIQDEMNIIKNLEQYNIHIVKEIHLKREQYYNSRGIQMPNKENAIIQLTEISHKDINELKRITKASPMYDTFAKPYLVLFDIPIETKLNGLTKVYQYWKSFKKFMQKIDFFRILSDFEVETISNIKFRKIEDLIIQDQNFSLENAAKLSDCLVKLTKWILGLIEIHKYLRRYSLSHIDDIILIENEKELSLMLDNRHLRSYRILRFINKFLEKDTFEYWKEKINNTLQHNKI